MSDDPTAQSVRPGAFGMATSAAKSMAQFAAAGFQTTTAEVQAARSEKCKGCEHHEGIRCQMCGCFTDLKAKMPHEDCPIGKWPA